MTNATRPSSLLALLTAVALLAGCGDSGKSASDSVPADLTAVCATKAKIAASVEQTASVDPSKASEFSKSLMAGANYINVLDEQIEQLPADAKKQWHEALDDYRDSALEADSAAFDAIEKAQAKDPGAEQSIKQVQKQLQDGFEDAFEDVDCS